MSSETILDFRSLDWNRLWKTAKDKAGFPKDRRAFWNRRAPELARHAAAGTYADAFLRLLRPQTNWNVLDVGCGAGTLALPLAMRVTAITALDISDRMLEIFNERCRELDIRNIRTVRAGWDDDWDAAGIETYDVVIASRSFYAEDLAAAVAKLNRIARERVVLAALVGDGPYDRRQYEAVGRTLDRGPDYIYTLNYLHQIGIYARLQFIAEKDDPVYPNLKAAVDGQRWMFQEMTPEEEERLRTHLAGRLTPRNGGWAFPKPKITRWAYIEWDPREGGESS